MSDAALLVADVVGAKALQAPLERDDFSAWMLSDWTRVAGNLAHGLDDMIIANRREASTWCG